MSHRHRFGFSGRMMNSRRACRPRLERLEERTLLTGNVIFNGDFEKGASGFTSDYRHVPESILDTGTFAVVTDPRLVHRDAASYRDHTSGMGLMMAANGTEFADRVLWSQTVTVRPGQGYLFAMWLSSWYSGGPAQLDVLFNDASVGVFTAPGPVAVWQQHSARWNGGANETLTIRIINRNLGFSGNDFAIDDLSLTPVTIVNSTADPGTGGCDAAECTLREAILAANIERDTDTIAFNLPGDGVQTIRPTSELPPMRFSTILDATTQRGYAGMPLVELDGTNAGDSRGLRFWGGGSVVRGLVINRFQRDGIELGLDGPGFVLEANFIGTDARGEVALGNGRQGVSSGLIARDIRIGGGTPGARNIISGNGQEGIWINAPRNTVIQGNHIGTDLSGTRALGNGRGGISLITGEDSLIGTDGDGVNDAGERNLISGNGAAGISLTVGNRLTIAGNYIGTNARGDAALGNSRDGITMFAGRSHVIIGTNGDGRGDMAERNLISGNLGAGMSLSGEFHAVAGNYIGIDVTGTRAVPNGGLGITSTALGHSFIGTNSDGLSDNLEGNVIAGNRGLGIELRSAYVTTVAGNRIGTNASGTAAVANGGGVWITSSDRGNVIGTNGDGRNDAGERNLISGNLSYGLVLDYSRNTWVAGNWIGIAADGVSALGNGYGGVGLSGGRENLIGTNGDGIADADERNVISGNAMGGVTLFGTYYSTVSGNYIGTNAAGTGALPNELYGILLERAQSNLIGTNGDGVSDDLERNLISGNLGHGVFITGADSRFNLFAGNYVGTNAAGTQAVPNVLGGITVREGARENWIGTNGDGVGDAAERNVISGNGQSGVTLRAAASNNVIAGNAIGTNAAGNAALANAHQGIFVEGASNLIGTNGDGLSDVLERNLISGNVSSGIRFEGNAARFNVVAGNWIGINAAGAAGVGNNDKGVYISSGSQFNVIGTDGDGVGDAREGNLISGNRTDGIYLTHGNTNFNVIAGNILGLDVTGTRGLGNGEDGIEVRDGPQFNRIGTDGDGVSDVLERNVISGNNIHGIALRNVRFNTVAGNYLGVNAAGAASLGNREKGVLVWTGAQSNVIGTNGDGVGDAVEGNVISGNGHEGVMIQNAGTRFNVVAGNRIGTDATGLRTLANLSAGVRLRLGAADNRIGTNGDGVSDGLERNVISGNTGSGVALNDGARANTVAGNWIGLDATGLAARPNQLYGVRLESGSRDNVIGSNADGQGDDAERNVIATNLSGGVLLQDSVGNVVVGNGIGTDATGLVRLGEMNVGVLLSGGTRDNLLYRNVIVGNVQGVELQGAAVTGNVLQGNFIGVRPDGVPLRNLAHGVLVRGGATGNVIGGTESYAGNTIAFNGGAGVFIADGPSTAILRNAIRENSARGIVNQVWYLPRLTSAQREGKMLKVLGELFATPGMAHRVEFFANRACDPSGYGEGERYLGAIDVTTDADGFAELLATFADAVPVGYFLAATATSPDGTTSEFSACQVVLPKTGPGGGGAPGWLDGTILDLLRLSEPEASAKGRKALR